jgi:hypothetical protein
MFMKEKKFGEPEIFILHEKIPRSCFRRIWLKLPFTVYIQIEKLLFAEKRQ